MNGGYLSFSILSTIHHFSLNQTTNKSAQH